MAYEVETKSAPKIEFNDDGDVELTSSTVNLVLNAPSAISVTLNFGAAPGGATAARWLSAIEDQSLTVGDDPVEIDLAAISFGTAPLTFSVLGAGVSLDDSILTIPADEVRDGVTIAYTVSNAQGEDTQAFTLNVAPAPVAAFWASPFDDVVVTQGDDPVTIDLSAFSGGDEPITFSATGSGVSVDGAVLTLSTDEITGGTGIEVTAANATGSATQTFTYTVNDAAVEYVTNGGPGFTALDGIEAVDTDMSLDGGVLVTVGTEGKNDYARWVVGGLTIGNDYVATFEVEQVVGTVGQVEMDICSPRTRIPIADTGADTVTIPFTATAEAGIATVYTQRGSGSIPPGATIRVTSVSVVDA